MQNQPQYTVEPPHCNTLEVCIQRDKAGPEKSFVCERDKLAFKVYIFEQEVMCGTRDSPLDVE